MSSNIEDEGEEEEELIEKVQDAFMKSNVDIINKNKIYISGIKESVDHIKGLLKGDKKDRLDNLNIIIDVIAVMGASVSSWMAWCNPKTIGDLTEEEMNVLVADMVKIMEDWIINDISVTEKVTKKIEKETTQLGPDEIKKNYVV